MSPENNSNLTPQQQKELDSLHWRIEFQQKTKEELDNNENIQQYSNSSTALR